MKREDGKRKEQYLGEQNWRISRSWKNYKIIKNYKI